MLLFPKIALSESKNALMTLSTMPTITQFVIVLIGMREEIMGISKNSSVITNGFSIGINQNSTIALLLKRLAFRISIST